MKLINWLIENWSIIVAIIVVIIMIVLAVIKFTQLSPEQQKAKIKKCLLSWVIEAERDLGSKTGQVKLSLVYGYFVTAFPFVKNFISIETFNKWVDEALDKMRDMLESNESLKEYIDSGTLLVGEAITPLVGETTENS